MSVSGFYFEEGFEDIDCISFKAWRIYRPVKSSLISPHYSSRLTSIQIKLFSVCSFSERWLYTLIRCSPFTRLKWRLPGCFRVHLRITRIGKEKRKAKGSSVNVFLWTLPATFSSFNGCFGYAFGVLWALPNNSDHHRLKIEMFRFMAATS